MSTTPEMTFEIERVPIAVNPRKLKVEYSVEIAQDLVSHIDDDLVKAMADEMSKALDDNFSRELDELYLNRVAKFDSAPIAHTTPKHYKKIHPC